MNIIDGNGASEVLRLSALHANKVVKTQVQKKPPLSDSICIRCGAKAGLEHRNYPYDLKRVKLIMLGMIPSLIPSVPTGDNRTGNGANLLI
ncbi:hypothetical protein [Escherichia coli]|uniref:hypothetical protein n=1 Tax=Escherichia coli TaxID=562 RepID=UPI000A19DA79|nr:hypothetical protein [Escherichia coli]